MCGEMLDIEFDTKSVCDEYQDFLIQGIFSDRGISEVAKYSAFIRNSTGYSILSLRGEVYPE